MLKVASLFSQTLGQVLRVDFQKLVVKHGAERHSKGFRSWTQFVSMLFCHLARADPLREICHGLQSCNGKLIHLGVNMNPNKSTPSYANEHRPSELFEDLFWDLLGKFKASGNLGSMNKTRFRFKNKLLLFDSTTITLCPSLFPWAKFRRQKGGIKLHVLLDSNAFFCPYNRSKDARQQGDATSFTACGIDNHSGSGLYRLRPLQEMERRKGLLRDKDEKECIIRCHGTTKDPPEQQCDQRRDRPSIRCKHLGEISAPR